MQARIAVVILALLVPTVLIPPACAEDAVGLAIGRAYMEVDKEKDDDLGFKVYGEYGVFPGLGLRLAYHNLGETDFCTDCQDAGGHFDTSVISLSITYTWSVSRMGLSGWAGYAYWYQDGETDTIEGPRLIAERGNDVAYGLGLDVTIARGLSARAEWEPFSLATGCDAEMLSFGLRMAVRQ
jgi:hypothetical protein